MLMRDICFVNVYGPNSDSPIFYDDLSRRKEEMLGEENIPIIPAGDLNLTLD